MLWELGKHRLLNGDCRKQDDIGLLLDGESPMLCITSPPYNQGLDKRKEQIKKYGGMFKKNKKFLIKMSEAYNDSMPEDEYQEDQKNILNLIYDNLSADGVLFYNHKHRYRNKECISPLEWILKSKWKLRQEIIWDRFSSIVQNAVMFTPIDERIYWLIKSKKFYYDNKAKKYSSIWRISSKNVIQDDCLPFPNKIPYRCMIACSKEDDVIYDPYAGTGTTLIIAEQLNRTCLCIEINKDRCQRIIERWEKFSNKQAKLINNF